MAPDLPVAVIMGHEVVGYSRLLNENWTATAKAVTRC
jgi:hypothetical protein